MHSPVLIGVDVGSSGAKASALDSRGRILAVSDTHSYPTHYPRPGWAEQNPEDWYAAACAAIRQCVGAGRTAPQTVAGLAVVGPAHNVALMDEAGNLPGPTIHWSDLRSAPQCERLERLYGAEIFRTTGQPVNPSWTLAQLLWLKENEPDCWARLRRVLATKDYVRYRLTGVYATDVYDAIGLQLYDLHGDHWFPEMCALIDFPVEWLPPVLPSFAVGGGLLPNAAEATGLRPGTPVAVGSADVTVEAFGIGAVEPGCAIVKLGTAGCINLVTAAPHPSERVEVIDPRCLVPLDTDTIVESVKKTGLLLVVEESAERGGWGAQVAATVADQAIGYLDGPIKRLASANVPMPFAPILEASVVPDEARIRQAIVDLVRP